MEGISAPNQRSDRVVLEANTQYWDPSRFPRLRRIIFDNTLGQHEALELVKTREGQVDLVTDLSPLETLRVAQSPHAKVVKNRGALMVVFGQFNLRKSASPWRDVRLRQAMNYAINRVDLIRYATKGNGEIIPALLPVSASGYDATLAPYPFDPQKARQLLREAGYPDGLALTLIAPRELEVQATVVGKMLEGIGLAVTRQILAPDAYNRAVLLSHLEQPAEQQHWDIALLSHSEWANIPVLSLYRQYLLGGAYDWGSEKPELRRLDEEIVGTVDDGRQQALIQQMERRIHEQAYALFLYNPIQLSAVNKAVSFVPYRGGNLTLAETAVTEEHWSVQKQKKAGQE